MDVDQLTADEQSPTRARNTARGVSLIHKMCKTKGIKGVGHLQLQDIEGFDHPVIPITHDGETRYFDNLAGVREWIETIPVKTPEKALTPIAQTISVPMPSLREIRQQGSVEVLVRRSANSSTNLRIIIEEA